MPKAQTKKDEVRRMALAQAIKAWTGSCCGIKKHQAIGKEFYYESYADAFSCAELNFPDYTERGTFYRGLKASVSTLIGLSKDQKTFVCDSCQCSSRSETKAQQFGPLILIFKNCLAIDAKLVLESNGETYNHKSEKEMIIPAYQSFRVVSIVGNYITLEEN